MVSKRMMEVMWNDLIADAEQRNPDLHIFLVFLKSLIDQKNLHSGKEEEEEKKKK